MSAQTEAKQEIAGQTKPPGLFHLPGVEPRHAEQAEEGTWPMAKEWTIAHRVVVTDERMSGGWISLNDHENDPCHHRG